CPYLRQGSNIPITMIHTTGDQFMFRKTLLYALAVALVAFVMTAQAADESQQLRIGAVMPLTGALQAYGETSVKGIKLAVEEINEAGGVLGEPIELEVADAQTKPQAGVEAANKLVNIDGVHAIIGAMGSGVAIPIALSVAKPSKVPQISPSATSPEVTTLDDDGFMFRTTASDAFQGVAMAQAAMEHGVDKTAVIYVNNDYGKGLADSFTEEFEAMGGEVTNTVAYEEKQASYRSALQKLWGDGSTQNLVVVAYVDDGETVLRQSLEGAMFDNFILSDGMKSKKLIEDLGADVMAGNIGTDAQPPEGSEAAERMKQAYADKYGEHPPEPYIDNSYHAVYQLALSAQ